jgi:NTP pyrophosphatase (non-canonical NTP hydrolase)
MDELKSLAAKVIEFRDEREWKQFHNPKDVALSLVLEAAELLEHFQWKSPKEVAAHLKSHNAEVGQELADILYWVLLLAHDLEIDLADAVVKKLALNAAKYPVKKAKGSNKKYTQL